MLWFSVMLRYKVNSYNWELGQKAQPQKLLELNVKSEMQNFIAQKFDLSGRT